MEEPQITELMEVILKLVDKSPSKRINAQQAINLLGPEWAERGTDYSRKVYSSLCIQN
jgi:hypothetical protein